MKPVVYHIEGVLTSMGGGWLLALDRPFAGDVGDTLTLDGAQPPLTLSVLAVAPSDDGAVRDIVVPVVPDLHDPRLLVGHTLRAAS